jgi:PAS domain S-box-containing protein
MPELRESGIDVLGKIPWGSHFCNFYDTKEDLLDILVSYLKAGLENNEYCLWIISVPGLITTEEAKQALGKVVPGLDKYLLQKKIEILDSVEWYLEGNNFNAEKARQSLRSKLDKALSLGYDGMRFSGDTRWLNEQFWEEFFNYEKKLDYSSRILQIIILCAYPLTGASAAEIFDIVQVHQFAIAKRKGQWQVMEGAAQAYARLEIKRLDEELQRSRKGAVTQKPALRYLVAVISVLSALSIALLLDRYFVSAPVSLFICTVMFSSWYGGINAGLVSILLSLLAFKLYFIAPVHSFVIYSQELPRLLIFIFSSLFVILLSASQSRKTESIKRARNILEGVVKKLQDTNITLQGQIAERRHAEDELRLAYQRLSYHFENTPLAVIELDKDLFIKRWSKRAEEIFGWNASEALGKNVHDDDFPIIYKEDIPAVDTINEQLSKGAVDRNLSLNRNYTKDGRVIYSEWYNSVLRDEQGNVITILSLVHNVTERKKTEETLNHSYQEIRRLTAHLQNVREEERIVIAREIHDELGQQLTVLKMEVKGLNKKMDQANEEVKYKIAEVIDLLDTMEKSVGRISSELRPSLLYNLGLGAAIEWHLKEFEKRWGSKTIFKELSEDLELADPVKNGLFRIFQESLTNISRHANAKEITVSLELKDKHVILSIEDDGLGFKLEDINTKKTFGIVGMRERTQVMGGTYGISSMPGKGTTVIVSVPYIHK